MQSAPKILIAALAAGLLASCSPSPQERMARAEKALAEHRYSHARPDFQTILQDDAGNRTAQMALVRIHVAQEDPDSALEVLGDMARRGPLPEAARLLRGEAHLMQGRYDLALADVDGIASADAWRVRAIAHTGRKEPDRVVAAFESGMRAPGSRSRLLADYAHFRMEQGDSAAARDLARRAVQADRTNLSALMVSGDLELAANRFRPALGWYSRASRLYPEYRPALLGRIAMLTELRQFDRARRLVTPARVTWPQDTDLLFYEARLAAETSDWAKARDLLQPFETSLDTMPAANALYAETLMRLGQDDQARVRLSSQLLREPENRRVRVLLGEAKLATDDPEGALETLAPVAGWADASKQERELLAEAEARASGG
jgi:predicted Zn-dependent protease